MNNNPENIKVGDLVMVVRPMPCCGGMKGVGKIFVVEDIEEGIGQCEEFFIQAFSLDALQKGTDIWWPIKALKKIDPPEEGDSLPTRKDIENKETA